MDENFINKYNFKTDPILEDLPAHEQKMLTDCMDTYPVKKKKILFREGAYPKGMYILQKGLVKIYQTNREGKDQLIYVYKSGDLMGYRPLICNETHPVTAAALEDSLVSFVPKKKFLSLLNKSSALANKLLISLSYEFGVWANRISIFAQKPVKERIAMSLLILSEKYKSGKPGVYAVINLSRVDLANYVGTTQETLVRLLHGLKSEKIISSEGRKIIILDRGRLIHAAKIR